MRLLQIEIISANSALRFPFDVENPVGYTMAVCVEFVFTVNIELFTTCVMLVAIGPCLILMSMASDLRYSLYTLNRSARAHAKPSEVTQQFNHLIDFHSKAKQLIKDFSNTMDFVFAVLFSWSMASICSGLLILQIEWVSFSSTESLDEQSNSCHEFRG